MPAAILAVHDLRYRLAFGAAAPERLQSEGHAYLHAAVPFAVVAAALGAGLWLVRAARAGAPRRTRLLKLWTLAFGSLLAIYAGQELLEGAVAPGHPAGLHGAFGDGGLWAIPAAAAAAAALALLVSGASHALELLADARARVALPRTIDERAALRPAPERVTSRQSTRSAPSRAPPVPIV